MRKNLIGLAVAAIAGMAAFTPDTASASCTTVQEPALYSSVTYCYEASIYWDTGTWGVASAGAGCHLQATPMCDAVAFRADLDKTGYDRGIWVDGRELPLK